MQLCEPRGGTVTRWGRLLVLLVFAAGFFTMHGFLAVSASAHTHLGQQHGLATDVLSHTDATAGGPAPSGVAAAHPGATGAVLTLAPGRPEPAEHHDLVAGCVVALVGVGLAGLALLLLRRRTAGEDLRTPASGSIGLIGPSAAWWSPPRVALCVIRV
ncbi:hypothetical protein [Aquipuribacter sp. MA13-6]|uniref:hypothetical protein n=1 Tax=unclassified Aquipuribacter TaxID=2635084 RepID=UPI003EEF8C0C